MDYLVQKVAYLKGLADGLGVDESTKEGLLLVNIVETLEEITEILSDNLEDQIELEEYVALIDEDLSEIEDDIYGCCDDEDCCCDEDYEFIDCCDDEHHCCSCDDEE